MQRNCVVCGKEFEAKRSTARYCGSGCRVRASRMPKTHPTRPAPIPPPPPPPADDLYESLGVLTATTAALEAAGRLESPAGQAAVALATRIDSPTFETGAAFAALVRQHGATLAIALDGAKRAADALDELRERRERKQHAG